MQVYISFAHDLVRKPVSTFRDHAGKKAATLNMGRVKGQWNKRNTGLRVFKIAQL
jgi:hypothetical protein